MEYDREGKYLWVFDNHRVNTKQVMTKKRKYERSPIKTHGPLRYDCHSVCSAIKVGTAFCLILDIIGDIDAKSE